MDEQPGSHAQPEAELAAELEAERELRARVHRHMGMLATILVLVAIAAAIIRMQMLYRQNRFPFSPWEALQIGLSALPWLLLMMLLAVLFTLGPPRLLTGIKFLIRLVRTGTKALIKRIKGLLRNY